MFQVFPISNGVKWACDYRKGRLGQLSRTQSLLGLCLVVVVLIGLFPSSSYAQEQRQFSVVLRTIQIDDEDDDLSADEPYLLIYQFKMRFLLSTDRSGGTVATLDRDSLVVGSFFRNRQNNLGFSSDGWAEEGHTYTIPDRANVFVADSVNVDESWVFGAVIVLMEEDEFAGDTVRLVSNAIKDDLQARLSGMSPMTSTPERIVNALLRDTLAKLRSGDIGGVFRRLLKITQPDDFGGIQVVVATVTPVTIRGRTSDLVLMYSGNPSASLGPDPTSFPRGTIPVADRAPVRLRFPAGD